MIFRQKGIVFLPTFHTFVTTSYISREMWRMIVAKERVKDRCYEKDLSLMLVSRG